MNLKTALATTALAALTAAAPAQAEEPAPTIELTEAAFAAALTAAEVGDVIVLPAGTLTLSKGYTIDKGVTVCGSGNRETIIKSTSTTECPFTLDCMNGATNTATLANLTIDGCAITGAVTNDWKYPPAAVQIDAGFMTNVTVRNCRPLGETNVSAVRLGGKTGIRGDVTLARMFDCTITNNNLGTISSSYGTVTVYYGTVSGCEIAYNKGRGAVGFFLTATESQYYRATITCCDIHHNTCYPKEELTGGATAGSGGSGRKDNVVADDPKFVNAAEGDYRLMRRSPCVDAGTSEYGNYAAHLKSDLDGTVRPQVGKSGGALPDIGCYEYRQKSGFMILLY